MSWGMTAAVVAISANLLWLMDAYFSLRRRVAKLEQAVGVGKPDRLALDYIPDDDGVA